MFLPGAHQRFETWPKWRRGVRWGGLLFPFPGITGCIMMMFLPSLLRLFVRW